ncbi:hypothetical protein M5K25_008958 [Dendrobium thyrsiflorum]|uniref:Cytochrome P450 n=1 Tax=Dendrobium thyrsiflorum TaxID=117978 RepID=A0ABD0VAN1_DENTH
MEDQRSFSFFPLLSLLILSYLTIKVLGFLKKSWWDPIRITKMMEAQGITGPAYKFFHGNTAEASKLLVDSIDKSVELSHDILPKVQPHIHSWIKQYGRNVLTWLGPTPTLVIGEAELVKEILNDKDGVYPKGETPKFFKKLLGDGVAMAKGEKWARQRKLTAQAFRADCVKGMMPGIVAAVESILTKWDELDGKEVDLFKEFSILTSEVISKSAFGSSYSEGKIIFTKLDQLAAIVAKNSQTVQLPFLCSKFMQNRDDIESSRIEDDIRESIFKIVKKREERKEKGEIDGYGDDLLGLLMSAHHEIDKEGKITMEDVIDECKTFYFGGQETTASMLSWTSLLLASNEDWQERARLEVMEIFGGRSPTSEDTASISKLKMMTMIMNESMRLYPPVINIKRTVTRNSILGNKLVVPKGMEIHISPIIIHHDRKIWGDDVHLFKPERFANGVAGAMAGQGAGGGSGTTFFPFGAGPRFCIGQGLAMVEAKVALAMILQRYKLRLSPSYIHSPIYRITIRPQRGLQVLLQKL